MKRIVIFTILLLFTSTLSNAAMKLDFEQAWELAKEFNRTLKLLKMEQKYADLQVKEAYSAAMPSISAVGSYYYNFLIPEIRSDFTLNGQKTEFVMALEKKHNYYGAIQLDQPLWIAGKIGIGVRIAKIYRQISELGIEQGESELKLAVTQAFYGSIVAAQFVELTRDTESQIKKHLENVKAMHSEGMVSEYDLLRAEVELANFQPMVTEAEEARKTAREGLRIILGLEPEVEFELEGEISEVVPSDIELESAIEYALQYRADLKQLSSQRQMLSEMIKFERRNQFWPNLFFNATLKRQAQEDDLKFDEYFWGDGLSTGISIQIPIFDGFKTSARVQQAKVNLKKNEIMMGQAVEGIRFEVKTAVWDLEKALDKLKSSRKAVQLAEKGYSIAEVRYAEGLSTQVELLDARLVETQSQVNELNALFDLISSNAAFDKAVGR